MKIQLIQLAVTGAGTFYINQQLDQRYKHLIGMSISQTGPSVGSYISRIKIRDTEIFPSGIETIMLQSGQSTAPNDRVFSLFDPIGISGEKLELDFNEPTAISYTLKVYCFLTNDLKEADQWK